MFARHACNDAHLGAELVHNVAKLVEVGLHLMVLEERGPAFPGLGKVCHHGCHWKSALPVCSLAARLQPEAGCMAVLSLPGGAEAQRCKCDTNDEPKETVDGQEARRQRLQRLLQTLLVLFLFLCEHDSCLLFYSFSPFYFVLSMTFVVYMLQMNKQHMIF